MDREHVNEVTMPKETKSVSKSRNWCFTHFAVNAMEVEENVVPKARYVSY